MTAYAVRSDVFKYGLPRGLLGTPAREVASVTPSTDTIELDGHGFETNDQVLVRASDGGTLPAPLAAGVVYFVIRLSDSTIKLAATANGSPIDITTSGTGSVFVAAPLPFDDVLEFYSRWVDNLLPAHAVPLKSPFPIVVTATVAELAAKKLAFLAGHSTESVSAYEEAAEKKIERFAAGLPLRDARVTTHTNKSVSSAVSTTGDPRGWGSKELP